MKNIVLRNFLKTATLLKKRPWCRCSLVNFAKFLRTLFFTEQLRLTASGLVKPCLNSDLYFISKTSGTALVETIVSYKPLPSLSRENRRTFPPAPLDTSTT